MYGLIKYLKKYRKREIPVRGRKLNEKKPRFRMTFIEKEKSPWGDENNCCPIHILPVIQIEKEKSPWGDENQIAEDVLSYEVPP